MQNANNIIPLPAVDNGGSQRLNQILQNIASDGLSPSQLSTIMMAAAGSLVASAATPTPAPITEPNDDRMQVDRKEAARRLSYSPPTVDRLVEKGELRPNRATGRPMFSIKELQRFVAQGVHTVRPPRTNRTKLAKSQPRE